MKIDNRPWFWIPLLNFASGLPYAIIISVSVIMYKNLGINNEDIGIYTSLLYLPWVIKPLWSPFIDIYSTKRKWFLAMQLLISIAFLIVGLTIPMSNFFVLSLAVFWIAAFASASNDVASDGFYMLALEKEQQSFFLGIRSTFYRLSLLTGNGLIVIIAGFLEQKYGEKTKAWSYTMVIVALIMTVITIYNYFSTPKIETYTIESEEEILKEVEEIENKFPGYSSYKELTNARTKAKNKLRDLIASENFTSLELKNVKELFDILDDKVKMADLSVKDYTKNIGNYPKSTSFIQLTKSSIKKIILSIKTSNINNKSSKAKIKITKTESELAPKVSFGAVFVTFFQKKQIGLVLAFILLFRLGESQLLKMLTPFLMDAKTVGGLGLTTQDIGMIYGTFGVISLTIGGILGGVAISRDGLGKWMLPMILTMHLPIIGFILLSHFHPASVFYVYAAVIAEQFGYGFGFAAFMMYLIYVADGESKTSHYSIATGFMALGMMLPGMLSGFIQEYLGYGNFFIWVFLATLPGLILSRFLIFPSDFGKKLDV